MLDIVQIIFKLDGHFFDRGIITVVDLCPAGYTRLYQQAGAVEGDLLLEFFDPFRTFRTRSHQADIPAYHIQELRQFIEVCPAQEVADARDANVLFPGQLYFAIFFCILAHGAELVHGERFAPLTGSDLPVDHRPSTVKQDQDGNQWGEDSANDQTDQSPDDVQQAFPGLVKATDAGFIHKGTNEPVGFQVVNGNPAEKFLVHAGHGNHFYPAFLCIQDGLEGRALHLAGDGNNDLGDPFGGDDLLKAVISSQDGKAVQFSPNFLGVIIGQAHQEERLWAQIVESLDDRLRSFACPDDQHPARQGLGREYLDINQPPDKGQYGCKNKESPDPQPRQRIGPREQVDQGVEKDPGQSCNGDPGDRLAQVLGHMQIIEFHQESHPDQRQEIEPGFHSHSQEVQ